MIESNNVCHNNRIIIIKFLSQADIDSWEKCIHKLNTKYLVFLLESRISIIHWYFFLVPLGKPGDRCHQASAPGTDWPIVWAALRPAGGSSTDTCWSPGQEHRSRHRHRAVQSHRELTQHQLQARPYPSAEGVRNDLTYSQVICSRIMPSHYSGVWTCIENIIRSKTNTYSVHFILYS